MGFHKPFDPFRFRDWRGQVGAPAFPPQTTSIEFNGIDEEMGNTSFQTLGFANVWSFMMWFRRRGDAVGLNNGMLVFNTEDSVGQNTLLVQSLGNVVNDEMRVVTRDSAGFIFKDFRFNAPGFFPFDLWHQIIITWDGVTLTVYENGVVAVPSRKPTNIAGAQTDNVRKIEIGGATGAVQPFSGFIHSIAFWDVVITSAIAEIFNGGVASTLDLNAASFAANLQHWWKLGQDPADLGKDSGIGSPLIDVNVSSINIDASDISAVSPP